MELPNLSSSDLLTILDLTRQMAERRLVAPLLDYIVDESLNLVDAERGYVVVFGTNDTLDFRATRDRYGQAITDAEDQISRSVLAHVRASQTPLVLRDALTDPAFNHAPSIQQLQLRSVMCVPLISYGQVIGAIYVENRSLQGRFTPEDATPLVLFAHQATIALDNAEQNEVIEERVATRTTELNRTLTELQTAYTRLEGLLHFARFMQHEVRGYAAGLEGLTALLRHGFTKHPQGARYVRHLDGLEETVGHMNDLTQRMMILSREGTIPIQQQQHVLLRPLLEQVRSKGLAFAERYDLPLAITLVCAPTVCVSGDALYVSLACYTGLRNAIEVLAEHDLDQDAHVDLVVAEQADGVHIRMRDNGPGFPAALLATIARAQQRPGGMVLGWSSKNGGSGLGLALMERVAQLHGGSFAIGNTPAQRGAWVELMLPRCGSS